ncbi:MAG TPA: Wzz/FepE/Etk N-terminal domain-containing protein [Trebonia sp.]|nr:Wzz/FepE/Etk N-terminal domain-containing protein [Trebonia sp.]
MSQQNLDLRRSVNIVRRHKRLFGGVTALGLLIGAAYAILFPPMLTSTALVVIAQPAAQSAQASSSSVSGTDPIIQTQLVVAASAPVLAGALPHVTPAMSLQELGNRISVASVDSSDIISISATGKSASEAEGIANAVANSYIAYVGGQTNPAVHVVAKVLESASTATGPKLPEQVVIWAAVGALGGMLVGFVVCLAVGRGDRRLVARDSIANSIAAPVLVSIPVERPTDPPEWARLLDNYEPDSVHAYGLSKMLQQLGAGDYRTADNGRATGSSLTVVSLTNDPTALALGPQLAAFAAAQGIPTILVMGPQQDANVTSALRTVCAAPAQSAAGQGKPLRLVVAEDGSLGELPAAFIVVVTVVDGQGPSIPERLRTTATVLGVSAGGVTAEQLARAATAAAADGRDILGILVANPDPDDKTTGRIPRLTPMRRTLPTRVTGLTTEARQ